MRERERIIERNRKIEKKQKRKRERKGEFNDLNKANGEKFND